MTYSFFFFSAVKCQADDALNKTNVLVSPFISKDDATVCCLGITVHVYDCKIKNYADIAYDIHTINNIRLRRFAFPLQLDKWQGNRHICTPPCRRSGVYRSNNENITLYLLFLNDKSRR